MEAKLIAFEGIDGSGKGTQCQLLVSQLESLGKKVLKFRYPAYQDLSSTMVEIYLGGRLIPFDPYAISSIYAVDHQIAFQKYLEKAYYDDETIIVLDRYIGSNIIHQMSRLDEREWDSYIEWIRSYEFGKLNLPRPDITFYMDIDPDVSMKMIAARCRAQNISPDIHVTIYTPVLVPDYTVQRIADGQSSTVWIKRINSLIKFTISEIEFGRQSQWR